MEFGVVLWSVEWTFWSDIVGVVLWSVEWTFWSGIWSDIVECGVILLEWYCGVDVLEWYME